MLGSGWRQQSVGGDWQIDFTWKSRNLRLSVANSTNLALAASLRARASWYASQARALEKMASDYLDDRSVKPLSAYEASTYEGRKGSAGVLADVWPWVRLFEIAIPDAQWPARVHLMVMTGYLDIPEYQLALEDKVIVEAIDACWL